MKRVLRFLCTMTAAAVMLCGCNSRSSSAEERESVPQDLLPLPWKDTLVRDTLPVLRRPEKGFVLRAPRSAEITYIGARTGDTLDSGSVLFRLSGIREERFRLQARRAARASARLHYESSQDLNKTGGASPVEELQQKERWYRSRAAAAKSLQEIAARSVAAPVSGVVTSIPAYVYSGAWVAAGDTLCTVGDTSREAVYLRVSSPVSEIDSVYLLHTDSVLPREISFEAGQKDSLHLTVSEKLPSDVRAVLLSEAEVARIKGQSLQKYKSTGATPDTLLCTEDEVVLWRK
ncbi:MAG: HlyD family efflux transporter periplasmic adaptor subunit [Fibrobacterota bacterium]